MSSLQSKFDELCATWNDERAVRALLNETLERVRGERRVKEIAVFKTEVMEMARKRALHCGGLVTAAEFVEALRMEPRTPSTWPGMLGSPPSTVVNVPVKRRSVPDVEEAVYVKTISDPVSGRMDKADTVDRTLDNATSKESWKCGYAGCLFEWPRDDGKLVNGKFLGFIECKRCKDFCVCEAHSEEEQNECMFEHKEKHCKKRKRIIALEAERDAARAALNTLASAAATSDKQ